LKGWFGGVFLGCVFPPLAMLGMIALVFIEDECTRGQSDLQCRCAEAVVSLFPFFSLSSL
jgi:hypothetical protein